MAAIWQRDISLELIRQNNANTASEHLGIEFIELGDDFLRGRVPVDARTRQPAGILHGGVSVVLAETLGSISAFFVSPPGARVVGLDINANHIRSVSEGWVTGTARPIHTGRTTHVWQIEMKNEQDQITCVSRLTMAILAPSGN